MEELYAFKQLQSTHLKLAIKTIQRQKRSCSNPKRRPVTCDNSQGEAVQWQLYLCSIKYLSAVSCSYLVLQCCSKTFSHKISEPNKILKSQQKELGETWKSHLVWSGKQTVSISHSRLAGDQQLCINGQKSQSRKS